MHITLLALLIIGVATYIWYQTKRRNANIQKKRDAFLKRHSDEAGFVCDGQQKLKKDKIQLFGGALGINIKQGDSIIDIKGIKHQIDEIYADKTNPTKPTTEMKQGEFSNALVIQAQNWDDKLTEEKLKKDGIILFRIESKK